MNLDYLQAANIVWQSEFCAPTRGVIICDVRLYQLYPQYFSATTPCMQIEAVEANKSLQSVEDIYRFLAEHNVHRTDIIHVFGGGVVCDLGAFAAATFKRGCRLKLYPSTLLAMVDAAIGGKAAVNHFGQRNLIGSFYPAEQIILHPEFLGSLPEAELRQGKAEMLKAYLIDGVLTEPDLAPHSTPNPAQILEYAHWKMQICSQDPLDMGLRRILNFGHSLGHVYERLLEFRYGHGDCVIAGISGELELQKADITAEDYAQIRQSIQRYPLPEGLLRDIEKLDFHSIHSYLKQDKKADAKGLKLPRIKAFRQVCP